MDEKEIDSAKNMITMSVYFIIADTLDIDMLELQPDTELVKDLNLDSHKIAELTKSIMASFDNLKLDFSLIQSVQDIVDQVLLSNLVRTNSTLH